MILGAGPWPGPYDVPVDLGREQAQRLAEQELSDPAYHLDDPSLVERVVRWVYEHANDLLERAVAQVPGGWWGLVVLLAIGAGVAALLVWRAGGVRRTGTTGGSLFVGRVMTAEEHRRLAEKAAASGRWEDAVRERFRALVRSLEERTVLDPRPGRTADEAAAEAGLLLPVLARDLTSAAETFDAVVYGGRPASSTDDRFMRELDRAVSASQPRLTPAGATR